MANHSGRLRGLVAILLLVMFIATCDSAIDPANWLANKKEGSKRKPSNANPPPKPSPKPKLKSSSTPKPAPNPEPTTPPAPIQGGSTFDVLDYGAKGDGVTDDTMAFLDAWAAACNYEAPSATMFVPSNREFLVGPISFSGPCKPNIVFQLDGTIIAPTSAEAWGTGRLQWLEFRVLEQVEIQGQGTIEGRGSAWWSINTQYLFSNSLDTEFRGNLPHTRPTALRFFGSSNVTVTGITIQNSQQCHLKFDSCQAVEVSGVTISSPGDSPNTDGIHLQNSVGVTIRNTDMACGDDCISIQTGCSNILIQNVKCGPGHGISIGGLGKGNTQATVSDVTVQNADLVGTPTGVRIKTWQGGSGYAKGLRFSNIKVSQVMTPIVIDQFYCDQSKCKNQTSAVALSDITYNGVAGTYTTQPVRLACSDSTPCSGIHLSDIQLQLAQQRGTVLDPFCWKAYGDVKGPTEPDIHCLIPEN